MDELWGQLVAILHVGLLKLVDVLDQLLHSLAEQGILSYAVPVLLLQLGYFLHKYSVYLLHLLLYHYALRFQ